MDYKYLIFLMVLDNPCEKVFWCPQELVTTDPDLGSNSNWQRISLLISEFKVFVFTCRSGGTGCQRGVICPTGSWPDQFCLTGTSCYHSLDHRAVFQDWPCLLCSYSINHFLHVQCKFSGWIFLLHFSYNISWSSSPSSSQVLSTSLPS